MLFLHSGFEAESDDILTQPRMAPRYTKPVAANHARAVPGQVLPALTTVNILKP